MNHVADNTIYGISLSVWRLALTMLCAGLSALQKPPYQNISEVRSDRSTFLRSDYDELPHLQLQ